MNFDNQIRQAIGAAAVDAARAHARAEFPKESCGFVAHGEYVACENTHQNPTEQFSISDPRYAAAVVDGSLSAVIHSHPNGTLSPSELDMRQQIASAVPWVIVSLNEDKFGPLVAWGDTLAPTPVIARPFVHGVFDCYSLIRDCYRYGRSALAEQGVDWPFDPVLLPEFPRDDDWWSKGGDLYSEGFAKAGFRVVSRAEAQPGDVFMLPLGKTKTLNHGGLLLSHNMLLHHVPTRPSARIVAGYWMNAVELWVRHEVAGQ